MIFMNGWVALVSITKEVFPSPQFFRELKNSRALYNEIPSTQHLKHTSRPFKCIQYECNVNSHFVSIIEFIIIKVYDILDYNVIIKFKISFAKAQN